MKNLTKRYVVIVAAAFCALVLSVVIAVAVRGLRGGYTDPMHHMQVYFFSPNEGRLYAEGRTPPPGDNYAMVMYAVRQLAQAPLSNGLTGTWPAVPYDKLLADLTLDGNTLVATFYDAYMDMSPLEEALFRSAFTLTMVGMYFIDSVQINVNGSTWTESSDTIANAPSIGPARLSNTQLILYFIDESGTGLVREYYNAVDVDVQQRVRVALERLITGTDLDGAFSLVPQETRIRAVTPVSETASIYINLSSEFSSRFNGSAAQAQLMLGAVVNTVIANARGPSVQGIRQVFFLIDSSRQEQFHGVSDFMRGFEYDPSLLVDVYAEAGQADA